MDLYVLERAFSSTHPQSEPLFAGVLEAYETKMGKDWAAISRRLDDGTQLRPVRHFIGCELMTFEQCAYAGGSGAWWVECRELYVSPGYITRTRKREELRNVRYGPRCLSLKVRIAWPCIDTTLPAMNILCNTVHAYRSGPE